MTTPPDPALRALLRGADPAADLPAAPAPAAFAAAVHARIRAADTAPLRAPGGLARHLFPLAAALAVLASLGAGSAVAYARHERERTERYATAFARSIDPWLMHAARSQTPAPPHVHR